jgi:hypothetical protein
VITEREPGRIFLSYRRTDVQVAIVDLEGDQDVEPPQRHRTVDVEEVNGRHAGAWVRRNCRQLVSVCRTDAGGIR